MLSRLLFLLTLLALSLQSFGSPHQAEHGSRTKLYVESSRSFDRPITLRIWLPDGPKQDGRWVSKEFSFSQSLGNPKTIEATERLSLAEIKRLVVREILDSGPRSILGFKVFTTYQKINVDGNEPALSTQLSYPSSMAFAASDPSLLDLAEKEYFFSCHFYGMGHKGETSVLYAVIRELPNTEEEPEYDVDDYSDAPVTGVVAPSRTVVDLYDKKKKLGTFSFKFDDGAKGRMYFIYYVWVDAMGKAKKAGNNVNVIRFNSK